MLLRTKDFVTGINKPEIEDLLRATLVSIVKAEYGIDLEAIETSQPTRPIIDIFSKEIPDFSKYKLAKAFIKWTRTNDASALTQDEQTAWKNLIQHINKALK